MASLPTKPKPKFQTAETSFQEPDKTSSQEPDKTSSQEPDKDNFPMSSSSSSFEVKTVESSSDPLSDTSPGDLSSTPSAAVTTDQEQAQLTLIPVLKEFVRSVPSQETLPIFSPSESYGGLDEGPQPASTASVLHESEPLIDHRQTGHGRQFLGSDSPTNLDFPSQLNSSNDQPTSVQELTFMQHYTAWSIWMSNSFFIVPFLLALLAMCVFALYMGGMYYDQCQLMEHVPLFLVLTGGFGAFAIVFRITYMLSKKGLFPEYGDIRYATIAVILAFICCHISGTAEYIQHMNDYTTKHGPGYCDPFFYIYCWWNNWAVFIIIIILAVVHGPNSTRMAE